MGNVEKKGANALVCQASVFVIIIDRALQVLKLTSPTSLSGSRLPSLSCQLGPKLPAVSTRVRPWTATPPSSTLMVFQSARTNTTRHSCGCTSFQLALIWAPFSIIAKMLVMLLRLSCFVNLCAPGFYRAVEGAFKPPANALTWTLPIPPTYQHVEHVHVMRAHVNFMTCSFQSTCGVMYTRAIPIYALYIQLFTYI